MAEKSRRSTGTATITFGMVSIPAKLYAATESKDAVSFHMLHGQCGSRLKQQYVCLKDGEVVERDAMVKGYEVAKDQYITFAPEELKALAAESSEAIEITEFVPVGAVDPIYFEKASYIAPEKAGAQAFALLLAAMRQSGREAIGKYAARGKQYVVLLRPAAGALVVHTLRYAGEVREPVEVPAAAPVGEALLDLALKLVAQKSAEAFDPSKYRDEVSDRILVAIERKVGGDVFALPPIDRAPSSAVDLLAALAASVGRAA